MSDTGPRLTLLAGGDAVYVYAGSVVTDPDLANLVATQRMMIDVAYPAGETMVKIIPADAWPAVHDSILFLGTEIIDTREAAS